MTSAQDPSSTICPSCQQSQSDPDADFCQSCRFPLLPIANKYRLEQLLNEGGFSHVYLARHIRLKRNAERVIKIIKGDLLQRDPSMEERFYREVQMTADLSHQCQHVVRVFDDFGDAPKLGHYYVMEYLQGGTLAELMKSAHELLSFEVAVHIASQLCDAMHWAHKSDIIHRDLKPANIMLIDYEGDAHYVKVLDFGIAKSFAEEHAEGKQFTQGAIGTPTYMAPEHFKGGEVDFRADLYSLGVIFYELLAGRPPFLRQNNFQSAMIEMMEYHTNSPVPPLQEFRPDIPPALAEAIHEALAKKPEDRYSSAREFKDALQAGLAPQAEASHSGLALPSTTSGSFPRATPSGTHAATPSGSFQTAPSGSFKATPTPPPATSSGAFNAAPSGSFKATPSGSFKATSSGSFNATSGSFSAAPGSFPPRSASGSYPASPSGSYPPPPPKRKTGSHAAKPPPPPPSYSRSSMPAVGQDEKDKASSKDEPDANETHVPGFPGIPSPTTPVKKPDFPKEVLPPQPFKSLAGAEGEESAKKSGKISLRLDNRLVEGAQITMDPQAEPLTIDDIEEAQSEDDLDSTAVLTADDITMSFRRQDAERVSAAILSTEDITTAHLTTKKDLGSTGILTAEDMTTETRRLLDMPEDDASSSGEAQVPSLGSHATPSISAPTDAPDATAQGAGTSPSLAPTSVEETVPPQDDAQREPSASPDSSEDPATAALMKLLDPLAQAQTDLGVADTTIQANPFLSDPDLFELATGTRPPDLRPDDLPDESDESPAEATPEEEPVTGTIETSADASELSSAGMTPTIEEEAQEAEEAASQPSDADRALEAVENSLTTVTPPPPATPEEITAEYFGSSEDVPSAPEPAEDEEEQETPSTINPLTPEMSGPRISEQETTKVHGIQVPMELLTGEISEDDLDEVGHGDDLQSKDDAEASVLETTPHDSPEEPDATAAEEGALDASASLDSLDEPSAESLSALDASLDDNSDETSEASSAPPVDLSSTVQFHPNLPLPPKVEAATSSTEAASLTDEGDRSTLEYDRPLESLPGPSFDDVLAEDEGIAMSSVTVGFETPGASIQDEKPPAPFGALLAPEEEVSEADASDEGSSAEPTPEAKSAEGDSSQTDFADLLGPDMYHEAVSDAELLSMEALLDQASKETAPPAPAPPQEAPRSEEQSTLEVHALSLDGDDPFGLLEDDGSIQSGTVEAGAFDAGAVGPGTIEADSTEPEAIETLESETLESETMEPGTIESDSVESGTVEDASAPVQTEAPEPPFGRDPFARFSDSAELHTLDRDQPSHETLEQPEPSSETPSTPSAPAITGFDADIVPPDATQEIAAPPPSVIIAQSTAESSEDEIEYPSLLPTDQGTVPSTQAVPDGERRPGSGGQQSNHMPIIVLMLVGGVLLLIGAFMML